MVSLNTLQVHRYRTSEIMDQLEENFKQMPRMLRRHTRILLTGSGPSYGMFMISLKDWGEAEIHREAITRFTMPPAIFPMRRYSPPHRQ
ncbi:MAG: hypothetical protein ACLU4J_03975 [Butyricimonas paravirosa]